MSRSAVIPRRESVLALVLAWVLLALFPSGALADEDSPRLVGKVFKVTDGDSLKVQLSSGPITVRMDSMDAPESNQPHGAQARAALTRLVLNRTVSLEVVDQDRYERLVAVVYLGEENINRRMVAEGHAWAYRRYLKKRGGEGAEWCRAEDAARRARLGLWALNPRDWIFPSDWRRLRRGQIERVTDYSRETAAACIAAIGRR